MEKDRPKIAVNVFVLRGDKLLLGRRKNTIGDGDWGLPGGHLERMESLTAGAKRELEEETGLKAGKLSLVHIINDPRTEDNTHYMHVNFLAKDVSGEPELREPNKCYEWRWFQLSALPDNIFLGHRKCIAAFPDSAKLLDYEPGGKVPDEY